MRAGLGRLLCRLGRHAWEYLIFPDDDLVRWCPRCRRPKALTVIPAKRIPGSEVVTAVTSDRPLRGLEELRTAVAMLKAISRDDPAAVMLLGKHADQVQLVISLLKLVVDALNEPSSTDLESYTERAFARLDRSP